MASLPDNVIIPDTDIAKYLNDENGNVVYPVTKQRFVLDSEGNSLDLFTTDIEERVTNLENGKIPIENSDWSVNDSTAQSYVKNRTHWDDNGTVHKLDNKYIDSDSTPTIGSNKPITSDAVAQALGDVANNYATKTELTNIANSKQDVLIETDVIPVTGMLPNTLYNYGTIGAGTTTFLMNTTDVNPDIINIYFWKFRTGALAPTIVWPADLIWYGDSAPVLLAGRHYEVSVQGGLAICIEASLS